MMRMAALALLAVAAVSAPLPAPAQTFDPSHPVCMHVVGDISYYDCSFTTLAQCAASASGRAAGCLANPFFAYAEQPVRPRRHGRRRRQLD
jgi:Protein of unknown function (DUF3551)